MTKKETKISSWVDNGTVNEIIWIRETDTYKHKKSVSIGGLYMEIFNQEISRDSAMNLYRIDNAIRIEELRKQRG